MHQPPACIKLAPLARPGPTHRIALMQVGIACRLGAMPCFGMRVRQALPPAHRAPNPIHHSLPRSPHHPPVDGVQNPTHDTGKPNSHRRSCTHRDLSCSPHARSRCSPCPSAPRPAPSSRPRGACSGRTCRPRTHARAALTMESRRAAGPGRTGQGCCYECKRTACCLPRTSHSTAAPCPCGRAESTRVRVSLAAAVPPPPYTQSPLVSSWSGPRTRGRRT